MGEVQIPRNIVRFDKCHKCLVGQRWVFFPLRGYIVFFVAREVLFEVFTLWVMRVYRIYLNNHTQILLLNGMMHEFMLLTTGTT